MAVDERSDRVAVADGSQPLVELTDAHGRGQPLALAQGLAVGVAWAGRNLLVQTRQPSTIVLLDPDRSVVVASLPIGEQTVDYGHMVFHDRQASGVACQSCHPEAGDDGFVWNFAGRRVRTPSLAARWLNAEPYVRAASSDRAAHGQRVFVQAGCDSCHAGLHFTDNLNHDVGTGGFFQTPSLRGLRVRAPYFHNGCATTIADRFGPCHTEGHGRVEGLDAGELRDLIAYLETL